MRAYVLAVSLLAGSPLMAQDDFDQRVMEAILNNPEVVLLAIQKLEEERERAETAVERQKIYELTQELFGNDPQIQLVEFFGRGRKASLPVKCPISESSAFTNHARGMWFLHYGPWEIHFGLQLGRTLEAFFCSF